MKNYLYTLFWESILGDRLFPIYGHSFERDEITIELKEAGFKIIEQGESYSGYLVAVKD